MQHTTHTQTIQGNNNFQVGGNLTVNDPTDFDSSNPNILDCPQCWKKTGRYSNECKHCGFQVKAYFDHKDHQEYCKKASKEYKLRALAFIIIGPLISHMAHTFMGFDTGIFTIVFIILGGTQYVVGEKLSSQVTD